MGVIIDQFDLVDSEPDQPRSIGQQAPPPPRRDEAQTLSVLRHAARRHARVWAD